MPQGPQLTGSPGCLCAGPLLSGLTAQTAASHDSRVTEYHGRDQAVREVRLRLPGTVVSVGQGGHGPGLVGGGRRAVGGGRWMVGSGHWTVNSKW